MGLVVTAVCGSFCIACLRPLTRRYVFFQFSISRMIPIYE
ncbi:hypothetical protein VXI04_004340 [Vibrio vulnificus]|nr:hypothetical protein [Vibrio vulnificus]EHZ2765229.1 hypothetical protein [Vibrio vulnificus]EKD8805155.1 hypothetical protein [Vibrio vulnificus]EKD9323310.1 hypothetical protein [Vibrio vulnificus]EME0154558.1 hypothetical protein [Vibrio vulnificus]